MTERLSEKKDFCAFAVVTAPQSVAFLRSIYEQAGPGHLEWNFSRPGRVSARSDRTFRAEDGILTLLRLENAGLTGELKINGPVEGLEGLQFRGNQLQVLELKNMPHLLNFEIFDEYLTSLTFGGGLGRMNYEVRVEAGNLARLEVKGRNKLSELYIRASQLEDLDPIRKLKDLAMLMVHSHRLADLRPLKGRSFMNLYLESPLIGDLSALGELKYLDELHISGQGITDLEPLVNLRSCLHWLYITAPLLADIRPLAKFKKLAGLGISSDALTDLTPLAGFRLHELFLEGREIKDLSPLAEMETHLVINGKQLKGNP